MVCKIILNYLIILSLIFIEKYNTFDFNSLTVLISTHRNFFDYSSFIKENGYYIECPQNKTNLNICQEHYLMYWDSSHGGFVKTLPKGQESDVTYFFHTTY